MNGETLLVIDAHPSAGNLGPTLADAYARGASGTGAQVTRLNLRELSFDPVLREASQPLEPDLQRAKQLIEQASHAAWVFPCWWSGLPALLKGFVDRLFLPGWAYQYEKGQALPKALLKGRSARQILTMDSPNWWYTLANHRAIHGSFVTGTLSFVGFAPIRTRTAYQVRELDEAQRETLRRTVEMDGAKDARALLARSAKAPQRVLAR